MRSAFEDVVVCWHMAGVYDSSGSTSLVPRGRARVGMPLSETAAGESKRRGGNGSAVRLTGGWLEVNCTCAGATALTGRSMSLCLRVLAVEGTRGFKPCTLMSRGEGDGLSCRLAIEEGRLFFRLGVSSAPRPASLAPEDLFEISVPIGMIESLELGPLRLRAVTEAITLRGVSVCPLEETFSKGSRSW